MLDYNQAKNNLDELLTSFSEVSVKNEAQTRFHFIDEFLTKCLGWDKDVITVEKYESGDYTDYEIGIPKILILEAKREGTTFELPIKDQKTLQHSLLSIIDLNKPAKEAIEQVQGYCSKRGVRYAAVSNGPQLIVFIATRTDGDSPFNGQALVIDGYAQMKESFAHIYQFLSPDGLASNRLLSYLDANEIRGIPDKFSSSLTSYNNFRYQTESANQLRLIAELLLEDIERTPEVETQFYRECYCESGALSQDALISKNLLKTRYAALFNPQEKSPILSPARGRHQSISPDILAEALTKRPLILIGDVGVGKTSFIKNLILIQAPEEFKKSIYLYIDLGVNSFLDDKLETFITSIVENQLSEKYSININYDQFVSTVYADEIKNFEKGIYGSIKDSSPETYRLKLIEMLNEKISNKEEHLKKSFAYISKSQKKQIVIVLDNIDQRELEIQQRAFIISQSIAQHWQAIVFLAVRPNTFHQSKRSGSLSAYPNKVFYIMPPRPEQVLERRLIFALNMAEGKLPIESLQSVSINLSDIALYIKSLLHSIKNNPQLTEFLSNITGGNVRSMLDFVTKFIGSPNVDSDKIISIMATTGEYFIPIHEFTKAALLGDYSRYEPKSSIAFNLFDVRYPDKKEHFLCCFIIGYLNYDAPHRNHEGFVTTLKLEVEMQNFGYSVYQIESALRRLTNKRLIETTQRVTFEESTGRDLQGDMPDAFRITTVGAYHLSRWCGTFEYLDAMIFDTPIFDDNSRLLCQKNIESFEIKTRLSRTSKFRDYLSLVWTSIGINVAYFDWLNSVKNGEPTFDRVRSHISRPRQN